MLSCFVAIGAQKKLFKNTKEYLKYMKSRFDPLPVSRSSSNYRSLLRNFLILATLPIFLSFIFAGVVLAQERATVDKISAQIESLFPLLEGYIVSVEGDRVILDFKQGQAISKGDRLKLIRYGADIIHPVSKEKIGRKETDLGEVEVLEVRPDFTLARPIEPKAEVKVGDGVRLPFKQISLLVAPPQVDSKKKIDAQQLQVNLQQSLGQRARFKVPVFELGLWMLENDLDLKSLRTPENLARLQKEITVNFILAPEVKTIRGKTVLGYKLYSAQDGTVKKNARLLAQSLPVESERGKSRPTQNNSRRRQQQEDSPFELIVRQNFKFTIVDLDVGDVTGDGRKELILINENRVMIYRQQAGGKFKRVAQYKPKGDGLEFLSVDALDLNGNGRVEIFVTCKEREARLVSFVLEVKGKRFQTVWSGLNRYFRVIRSFDRPPIMLTQTPGFQDPFHGPIETVKFEGGKYRIGSALKIPEKYGVEFTLYGFNQGGFLNKKQHDTIILDNDFYLRVYSPDGRIVFKSEEYFGHDPRLNSLGVREDSSGLVIEGKPVSYKGRVGLIQRNKERFLALPKNHRMGGSLMGSMVVVNSNSLMVHSVEKDGIEKYFETKKQKGYQASFQVVDGPDAAKQVYIGSVEKAGRGSEGLSSLVLYNWKK